MPLLILNIFGDILFINVWTRKGLHCNSLEIVLIMVDGWTPACYLNEREKSMVCLANLVLKTVFCQCLFAPVFNPCNFESARGTSVLINEFFETEILFVSENFVCKWEFC